ncbi:MAG: FixH family protein [Flavobacteriaceae bacterium]|nr:FixH family protein [Flavobacteriaceae bacterium]
MKFNWGTGIVVGLVLFIAFIMYFVVQMAGSDRANHELVVEDYYKQELAFQSEIDAENRAKAMKEKVEIIKKNNGIEVIFPSTLDANKIKGNVFLYRPSNERLDFNLSIVLSNSRLLIPKKRLLDGRWNMKVSWTYNNEDYLIRKSYNF